MFKIHFFEKSTLKVQKPHTLVSLIGGKLLKWLNNSPYWHCMVEADDGTHYDLFHGSTIKARTREIVRLTYGSPALTYSIGETDEDLMDTGEASEWMEFIALLEPDVELWRGAWRCFRKNDSKKDVPLTCVSFAVTCIEQAGHQTPRMVMNLTNLEALCEALNCGRLRRLP